VISRLRRFARAIAGPGLIAALGAAYIRLVARTTRWTVVGRDGWDALAGRPGGFICTTWHGRLFLAPTYVPPGKRTVAMISSSRDGDLIARIVARWGVGALRGSSHDHAKGRSKGGAEAFIAAVREVRDGALVAITPDGPRGPRMHAQTGTAQLARSAGAPVVAVAFSVRWGRVLSSWDRFLLPFPFGRGAIVFSEPRYPPEGEDGEVAARFRQALEDDLNDVTARADDLCGRARVRPAKLEGP
jgi:lysophospholipid acyltransferase (LPLAT)-like uncharacterized protein